MAVCDQCGRTFKIREAKEFFRRELIDMGAERDLDEFDKELCGECNWDNWWRAYEHLLDTDISAREQFDELWGWTKDES